MDRISVFGVGIWNPDYEALKSWFERQVHDVKPEPALLTIANAHTLNLAWTKPHYRWALSRSSAVINDGVGLAMAAKLRDGAFTYNFNGTDLFPRLFSEIREPIKVFLYGASEESNRGAAEEIEQRFPMVQIVGRRNGYSGSLSQVIDEINASGADLLLVALGQPRQELWLERNRGRLAVNMACGVGALFDFLSGTAQRAPAPVRKLRLEWLYRLAREPRRMFARYVVGNPIFLFRAWRMRSIDVAVGARASFAEKRAA